MQLKKSKVENGSIYSYGIRTHVENMIVGLDTSYTITGNMNTKLILVATLLFFAVAFAIEEEAPEQNEVSDKETEMRDVDEEDLKALLESDIDDEMKTKVVKEQKAWWRNKHIDFIKSAWIGLSLIKKYGDNYRFVVNFIRYLISDSDR
ncbi:uncharacterized protein TRIADDRAFT_63964 [Trichoplax adhaerens]|uniref:Expressed protein n=1 Tax=Trichoplax adhaerens TaxID=10228 RepID=B3RYK3_TRIAD|nr:expressed protein [Trichoplax adhaerens]EDV25055.1 expressed protein [Trichoplax adhaerens]|eukprot:XP_002112945.1 expressed protein [Trichoplax adhaerens]